MGRIIGIDVTDAVKLALFDTALAVLASAGWGDGTGPAALHVVDWAPDLDPVAPFTLALCRDPVAQRAAGAIAAGPFAILDALGWAGLEIDLAESVPPGLGVDRVLIGFNWTLVRSGDLCGIARSPARGTEGARTIRPETGFAGQDLRDLAQNLKSMDPLRRSLGLAAVNAFWNRADPPAPVTPHIAPRGGLQSIAPPGEGAVIVGGFRAALKRLPRAQIVEREPMPGDIPISEAPEAYAKAKVLAITAQTLMNGSLAPILAASGAVPYRILVGPSCPASPLVFSHGLDEVFGAVILDPDAAETFILESGTMIMRDHIATTRTLRRSAPLADGADR